MRRLLSYPAISFVEILLYRNLRHTDTPAERTVQMLPAPTPGIDAWHRCPAERPGVGAQVNSSQTLLGETTSE